MKSRPSLIKCLGINPFLKDILLDLLFVPGKINEKSSLSFNPFEHCVMEERKAFLIKYLSNGNLKSHKDVSKQKVFLWL